MNDLVTAEAAGTLSAATMEHVLGTGDISKLTVPQRVEFYRAACKSLGLNPLTRPIRFLSFQGQMQAYFTRDGTDQLRKIHNISLHVVDQKMEAGLYAVRVQAKMPSGRADEDVGVVVLPQAGESRANALMKATTKAKRRVTLSICGLGWSSEDELDTMPGAVTFDHDAEPSLRDQVNAAVPMPAAAAATPRPPRRTESATASYTDAQWKAWLAKTSAAMDVLRSRQEVVEVGERESVRNAMADGPEWLRRDLSALLAEHYARFPEDPEPGEELPDLEIIGEEKLAAG